MWKGAYLPRALRDIKEGSGNKSVYVCGSCVRGTWREGSVTRDHRGDAPFPGNLKESEIFLSREPLLGNPRDTQMKALGMGNSLYRGPIGKPGRISFTGEC
jgi:hypothetical protein